MNKRKFKDKITIYHEGDTETTRIHFEEVYFRHNKKTNMIDKRTRKRQYRDNNNTNNRQARNIYRRLHH